MTDRSIELEVSFIREGFIGGRLAERLETIPGRTYIVDRDASVMGLGGELYIKPGTVLIHTVLQKQPLRLSLLYCDYFTEFTDCRI